MTFTKDLLLPVVRLTPDDAHYFFGYYDIPAWSGDDSAHLVYRVEFRDRMPTPEDVAQLGLVHPGRDGFTRIAETTAWNFQQGAMLQWHPLAPDRKIIFNRRDGGRFSRDAERVNDPARIWGRPAMTQLAVVEGSR